MAAPAQTRGFDRARQGRRTRRGSSARCSKHASRFFDAETPSTSSAERPFFPSALGTGDATTYRPHQGARFLTRDPLEAVSRSAYGYVNNNPLNATDPSGLFPGDGILGGIGDFFTGGGCGDGGLFGDITDAVGTAWQWADDNSGHLAFAATIAAYGIPGFNVLAFGFGAWSAYGNFQEGNVLLGVIDLVGVGATGAALYYRAGAVSGRLGAHVAARSGQGYLVEPLTTYAASRHLRYSQAGRLSFAFGSLGEWLGL